MNKKLSIFLASIILMSSMSMAARVRSQFREFVPGVDETGSVDLTGDLGGEAIVKGMYNTRNGNLVATLRGRAPNLSGRSAVFRNHPELIAMFEDMVVANTQLDNAVLGRGVYRVTKRSRASGAAWGRGSTAPQG